MINKKPKYKAANEKKMGRSLLITKEKQERKISNGNNVLNPSHDVIKYNNMNDNAVYSEIFFKWWDNLLFPVSFTDHNPSTSSILLTV